MTATMNGSDLETTLARADRRWAERQGDEPNVREYLDHLANWLRPLVEAPKTSGDSAADTEQAAAVAAELRADNARLADELQAAAERAERNASEIEGLRADLAKKQAAIKDRDATIEKLFFERNSAVADVERLRAELAEVENDRDAAHRALDEQAAARVEPHKHAYPWTDPAELPGPCECGQEYPRAVPPPTRAVAEPEPEPWSGVLGSLRDELRGWPAA